MTAIYMTEEQTGSLRRKWNQDNNDKTFCEFVESAQPTILMDNAIVIQWCGMWLAIETDGYTHS